MKAYLLTLLLVLLTTSIAAENTVTVEIKISDDSLRNVVTLLALHLQKSADYADQLLFNACQEYNRLKKPTNTPSDSTPLPASQTHKYLAVFLKLKESDPDAALRFAFAIAQRLQQSTDSNDLKVHQILCDYIRLRYHTEVASEEPPAEALEGQSRRVKNDNSAQEKSFN